MTSTLQLAKDSLSSHLTFQVLDCTLDPLVTDGNLKGLTLHCLGRHFSTNLQKKIALGLMPESISLCKSHDRPIELL